MSAVEWSSFIYGAAVATTTVCCASYYLFIYILAETLRNFIRGLMLAGVEKTQAISALRFIAGESEAYKICQLIDHVYNREKSK